MTVAARKPNCDAAFRPVKHRPERLRDGLTLTKYNPEDQERRWLCAVSAKDINDGFRTCRSMRQMGHCPKQWEEADPLAPSPSR